ncbi:MAG TPA: TniB family NTP-binding protein, partial [Stenomitos sp.]
ASRSPGWLFNENLFKSLNTITHPKTLVSTPEGHANPNRDYWTDALEIDRGRIPVVRVEAIAPESGNFNWKDYFTRSLIAMEEPLIDYKIDYGERGVHRNNQGKIVIEPKVSAPNLRRALENALKHRCPDAFLIDEAQHLQKMNSGRRLQDNMDCIKSIANLTCVPHVIIGTYELLTFRNLSGQLSRRTQDIHFPRYQAKNPNDLEALSLQP